MPIQYFNNASKIRRWSNELRLASKEGGWFHWLVGTYWERTIEGSTDYYAMPGLQTAGQAWQGATASYYDVGALPPRPDDWYSYRLRYDYLQTTEFLNLQFDITKRLHLEVGTVHFHSHFTDGSVGGFWYEPEPPVFSGGESNKWNSKAGLSYKALDTLLVYADVAQGFRDGGVNGGLPQGCYNPTSPGPGTSHSARRAAPVRAGYADQLRDRVEVHDAWRSSALGRRVLLHALA